MGSNVFDCEMELTTNRKEEEIMLYDTIVFISSKISRKMANLLLNNRVYRKIIMPEYMFYNFEAKFEVEKFIIKHARTCIDHIMDEVDVCNLDHSKDQLHLTITILHVHFPQVIRLPSKMLEDEYTRIQTKEGYHPESEVHNPTYRINAFHVMQALVVNACRNLSVNEGVYNEEELARYCPTYMYNSHDRVELYFQFFELLSDLVKDVWHRLQGVDTIPFLTLDRRSKIFALLGKIV